MKLFWICILVCLTFWGSDRSGKNGLWPADNCSSEITAEQEVTISLTGTVSKEKLHRIYVLMRAAFVAGIQLDNSFDQHKSVIRFYYLFSDSKHLSAIQSASLFFVRKYAEVLSVRHNNGFYLFFFRKLVI